MSSHLPSRLWQSLRQNEVLLVLCVAETSIMVGFGAVSPVLPLFARTFDVGTALVGLIVGIFGLGRVMASFPTGLLADRFGRRVFLVIGPLMVTLFSLLSGLATDYWLLLVYRFLAGVGSSMFTTSANVVLIDVSTPQNRGRIMSIFLGSLLLGAGLGPAPGGVVADLWGLHAPFFLAAVVSALAMLWVFLRVPETRGRALVASSILPHALEDAGRAGLGRGLLQLLTDIHFILVGLVTLMIVFSRTGSRQTMLPLFASQDIGLSVTELGLVLALPTMINFLILPAAGILMDRYGRKIVIVPSTILEGVGLVLYTMSGSFAFFLFASTIFGVATGLAGPAPAAYAADLAPEGQRGMAMGLYRTLNDAGFMLGPVLLGWIADHSSYTFAMQFNALLLLAIALAFGFMAKETLVRRPPAVAAARS